MANYNTKISAAFIVAPHKGKIAATTRPCDRGEEGRIGLPGGKIETGEDVHQAALREAYEEGWDVFGSLHKIHFATVQGFNVVWLLAPGGAEPLNEYKEKGRIVPVALPLEDVANGGYGNDFLLENNDVLRTLNTY